jgi:hypothetical protein
MYDLHGPSTNYTIAHNFNSDNHSCVFKAGELLFAVLHNCRSKKVQCMSAHRRGAAELEGGELQYAGGQPVCEKQADPAAWKLGWRAEPRKPGLFRPVGKSPVQ